MFFKRIVHSFIAMSLLTTLGCSEFLNGKKSGPEVIEFSDTKFACLKKLPTTLKNFSVGEGVSSEMQDSFKCAQDALIYFTKRTRGTIPDAYTMEDMRRFFGKYFLKENNVSPEFAAELMKIKKALLGGSDKFITKIEILQLVDLLGVVRDEAIQLIPHVRVLVNQAEQSRANWDQVSDATAQLRVSAQRLLKVTQVAKSEYGFEDAKKLLSGFSEFVRGQQTFAPYDRYSDWVPLVEAVKNVLMGKSAQLSSIRDWSLSLDNLVDLYELVLKYHYVIRNTNVEDAASLRHLSQFAGQVLSLIESSHQMRSTGKIPFDHIDALIDQALPRMDILSVRAISLKEAYRVIVMRMLEPQRKGDARGLLALTTEHMAALRREFNVWRLSQSFIDHLKYDEKVKTVTPASVLADFSKFNSKFVIEQGLEKDALAQGFLRTAWHDFEVLLKSKYPANFNSRGRLIEVYNPGMYGMSWKSLTRMNMIKSLTRFLMIGYGENISGELTSAYMTEKGVARDLTHRGEGAVAAKAETGLVAWYDDFKNIGQDLKAFDPRSLNSGSRSFLEANFFTFSGNGDDKMDFKETFEFVNLLFSGGLGTANDIRASMENEKCDVARLDDFKNKMFVERCFEMAMRKNFADHFDNLPWLVRYVKGLNQQDWAVFYNSWLAASRVKNPVAGLVETADIRTMVMLLHYAESVMIMFDTNYDGALSVDEAEAAAPRFVPFFKKLKPGYPEFLLKEGFTYLIFKGQIPGAWDITKYQLQKPFLDPAPRVNLLRILQVLRDELNKKAN